jgi:hypothetical protein
VGDDRIGGIWRMGVADVTAAYGAASVGLTTCNDWISDSRDVIAQGEITSTD